MKSNATPLQPGESYTAEIIAALPRGSSGNLFVYIHLDTHMEREAYKTVQTTWWPADKGDNGRWLEEFNRWAHEDPTNNVYRAPINITYYEPILWSVTCKCQLQRYRARPLMSAIPSPNEGTRATRERVWFDRVFLSKDPVVR